MTTTTSKQHLKAKHNNNTNHAQLCPGCGIVKPSKDFYYQWCYECAYPSDKHNGERQIRRWSFTDWGSQPDYVGYVTVIVVKHNGRIFYLPLSWWNKRKNFLTGFVSTGKMLSVFIEIPLEYLESVHNKAVEQFKQGERI